MAEFTSRHIGVTEKDVKAMLETCNKKSISDLIKDTIPENILLKRPLKIPGISTEGKFSEIIEDIASKNKIFKSYLGHGWYGTYTPAVIKKNILNNPVWYSSYTPYQSEISQGRLEALINFQTLISELTKLPLANASMLDDATAGAEAARMMFNLRSKKQASEKAVKLFIDKAVFQHIKSVILTRCASIGIEVVSGDYNTFIPEDGYFGVILQYPNSDGNIEDYSDFIKDLHKKDIKTAIYADIMSLCMLKSPGETGADIAFGSTQRFGIPMGFGGPCAAYFATKEEYKRYCPGRIVGISRDATGKTAYRLSLQMREQHIKREKATSNICTATVMMANMAGFYAIYHGRTGLINIAKRIHGITSYINDILNAYGYTQENTAFFDTLKIFPPENVSIDEIKKNATEYEINLRYFDNGAIGLSVDETTDYDDIDILIDIFSSAAGNSGTFTVGNEDFTEICSLDNSVLRTDDFLTQEIFNKHFSEQGLTRYIKKLERKDISLAHSMIPLGSCTMKLNGAVLIDTLNYSGFANIHPFAPEEQTEGYIEIIDELEKYLCEITGLDKCCFQPNSGAEGEYAGLNTIKSYFRDKNSQRNLLLIPESAHGTNPASAAQAGFEIKTVSCDEEGNIDVEKWEEAAENNKDILAGCMITYPSTHGIFEEDIKYLCEIIHKNNGLVFMDGANMNAQTGLTSPGIIGADICHLNLHKTFAMPHGGGGPGEGPVCCKKELAKYLPGHLFFGNDKNAVSSAPYGNAMLLPVTFGYISLLGATGLKTATECAILNANYMAKKLNDYYPVLYKGKNGYVGHEAILDCRQFKDAGINETDIAKRLMDYGFHAPTLSFPVHGTLMVEPTESESKEEIDKFIESMISIYNEIEEIREGKYDKTDNVLKNAPHSEYELTSDIWQHKYTRSKAGYPLKWISENKFQIPVKRTDDAFGDRNLKTSV